MSMDQVNLIRRQASGDFEGNLPDAVTVLMDEDHQLVIRPWRLIYRIAEREIFVLSVIDSRQNVEDILLNRLIDPGRKI